MDRGSTNKEVIVRAGCVGQDAGGGCDSDEEASATRRRTGRPASRVTNAHRSVSVCRDTWDSPFSESGSADAGGRGTHSSTCGLTSERHEQSPTVSVVASVVAPAAPRSPAPPYHRTDSPPPPRAGESGTGHPRLDCTAQRACVRCRRMQKLLGRCGASAALASPLPEPSRFPPPPACGLSRRLAIQASGSAQTPQPL